MLEASPCRNGVKGFHVELLGTRSQRKRADRTKPGAGHAPAKRNAARRRRGRQPSAYIRTAWTPRRGPLQNAGMPIDLTDTEMATAATACRAMAYQEGQRAKAMENPTTRGPVESAAKRYTALAEKLEVARKKA